MFPWSKKQKGDRTGLEMDTTLNDEVNEANSHEIPTEEEQHTVAKIESDMAYARSSKESDTDNRGWSIEDEWEDDYYLWKGGGLHWLTKFAYRSKKNRRIRPNSENNFIFNALVNQHANITAQTPDVTYIGVEGEDDEIAKILTDVTRYVNRKNHFSEVWKMLVFDFITSGPTIAMVTWDNDWIGGRGPQRWIGDVRVERIDKFEMYFDPAIIDLQKDLQRCSYIIRRYREKLEYIEKTWEIGKYVTEQANEDEYTEEGGNPQQAYIEQHWHKGFPWFVPDERKQALLERADELEQEGEPYKAQDYRDSAKGDLEGVHVAYVSNGILLEYRPYEYEDGLYPFVFTTRYYDIKNQWGFGEIKNIKIPQVMHNKADEIEIEAMSKEGLGGNYYQEGAVNPRQLDNIKANSGKGGTWLEVDNINLIKPRDGVRVPASITNFKEHKQKMVETISGNTDIQQGINPSASTPFASIEALGARSDVRVGTISEKLEDFLIRVEQLKQSRFAQFYTEERYYRITGKDNVVSEGTFKNTDMMREWVRDTQEVPVLDEAGNQVIDSLPVPNAEGTLDFENVPRTEMQDMIEKYVPDFDVKVVVVSEKPTDRNYYTNLAMKLYELQLLSPEDLLMTFEEGKLPNTQDIIDKLHARQPVQEILSQIEQMPEEIQGVVHQQFQMAMQQIVQNIMMQEQQGGVQGGQMQR